MARIRSVKPEFWVDRSFVRKVPNRDARFLYMALWNLADEHARLMGDPAYVKGQAFPYAEDDDLTPKVVDALLDMLADAGSVVRYEVDGDPYLFLPRLAKHQRLESAKVPSRFPPPPRPDDPAPDPDDPAPNAVLPPSGESSQVNPPSDVRADKSARDSDESARDADKSALLYVAGCMEQVAGGRHTTAPDALFPPDPAVPRPAAGKPQPQGREPDPQPAKPKTSKRPASEQGTRIPEDFTLTQDMRDWGREHCPRIAEPEKATDEFVDYWRGVPGARGKKLNWTATWRNRMRELENRARDQPPPTQYDSNVLPFQRDGQPPGFKPSTADLRAAQARAAGRQVQALYDAGQLGDLGEIRWP